RLGDEATLWRSDGTSAGTFPVLEAVPSSGVGSLTTAGGLLFFSQGDALWRSDGSAAGTFKIPGPDPASSLFVVGPRVFFSAYDPVIGTELWAIDTRED
ncbi:MAG TPA: hyalin, partial [Thermoanaerobaculia bacterium]|nr:hyalin [Thermoanaerobaculia bacterium]